MRWFGASWKAPVCDPDMLVLTPVGKPCAHCSRPIGLNSQGVLIPHAKDPNTVELHAYHRLCVLALFGDKITVHILDQGLPLCRFSIAVPGRWPHGHHWTKIQTKEDCNCDECLRVLADRE